MVLGDRGVNLDIRNPFPFIFFFVLLCSEEEKKETIFFLYVILFFYLDTNLRVQCGVEF